MSNWLPLPTERLYCKNFSDEFLLLRRQYPHSAIAHSRLNPGTATLPTLGQRVYDHKFPFVDEVIATEVEICLRLKRSFRELGYSRAIGMLCEALKQPLAADTPRDWRLPVYFSADDEGAQIDDDPAKDAPQNNAAEGDWSSVEQASGLLREQVVERLLQVEFQLAMFGFLPGFAYLSGLPRELHIPRKRTPATVTPANALALGGKYLGIYSLPSPAGWNVIGRLGVRLMQLDTLPPIPIRPGDRVRLEQIDVEQLQAMQSSGLTLADHNSHS